MTGVSLTWQQCVRQWYPDLLHRAQFLPHVYMYHAKHDTTKMAHVGVTILQQPVETQSKGASSPVFFQSDVRDDLAQQHVLHCLRELAGNHGDVMFVLSQLNFGDYLGAPCYASAASRLPRPVDLKAQELDRGDFDVLIVHRQYGLLVGEIKSAGANASERGASEEELQTDVLKTVKKMLKLDRKAPKKSGQRREGQLEKAREVLKHVVGDLNRIPRVRATLILPNITSTTLRQALSKDPLVTQALCRELDLPPGTDPVDFCLCADQMSDRAAPHDVTDDVISRLSDWWQKCMSDAGPDPAMTEDSYVELVARFAGPASLVKIFCQTEPRLQVTDVRTEGQFIAEVGDRLSSFVLYPYQADLVHTGLALAFLAGPPGTGKTLTIVVMALEWLRKRRAVHILSGCETSHAVALQIKTQLEKTAQRVLGSGFLAFIHVHLVDLNKHGADLDDAVEDLVMTIAGDAAASGGRIGIIADEASYIRDGLEALYGRLRSRQDIRHVCLWGATLKPGDAPPCLESHVHEMTEPLRSPPSVIREVQEADDILKGRVPKYSETSAPPPCDGPPVMRQIHGGPAHSGGTENCETCGEQLKKLLVDQLHVGQDIEPVNATGATPTAAVQGLKFQDVFILSWTDLHDEERDIKGHVTRPASGIVRGLRRSGVPVRVVAEGDVRALTDVAVMSGDDAVTVTNHRNIWGLERKVVVWLGSEEKKESVRSMDNVAGRLLSMSRATAQLVWVKHQS